MTDLPEPPVPADLDLRDFRWMKLDLTALFNSDFNATADDTAWRAGVTLWGKAWHQVPAGSLPDDDATLCNLAGLGRDMKTWKRIRAAAMHGFVRCSDGRLYHTFLCKTALSAAAEKQRREAYKAADRARKSKSGSDGIPPEKPPGIPSENSHMERERENKNTPLPPKGGGGGGGCPDWEGIPVDKWEPDRRGKSRPVVAGWHIDIIGDKVLEAAGLPLNATLAGGFKPLAGWLRDGLEGDEIVAAIKAAAPGMSGVTASLARFDGVVRAGCRKRGAA